MKAFQNIKPQIELIFENFKAMSFESYLMVLINLQNPRKNKAKW